MLGRIRANLRTYLRKQLELPRQEIAEIVRANLRAVAWFAIAVALALGALVAFTFFVVALLALLLPLWAAALAVLVLFLGGAGLAGYVGFRKLELRGPTRTITSVKETIRWAKARLLGRSAS